MPKIQKISADVRSAILRKSAYSLPNNPSDSGFKAKDIRNAFYKPIIDLSNSALTEIDRIAEEVSGVLRFAAKDVDLIERVAGLNYHGSDVLIYSFSGSAFEVSGNDEAEGEVIIPSFVFYKDEYYPVVAVAANAFSGSKITKAEIASTVEAIGNNSFRVPTLVSVKFRGRTSVGENAFSDGNVAFSVPKEYLTEYETSLASYKKSIIGFDTVKNNALTFDKKVDKISGEHATERAYVIARDGTQITRQLSETPADGEIPVYHTGGRISVNAPEADDDAAPKAYVDSEISLMLGEIKKYIEELPYAEEGEF